MSGKWFVGIFFVVLLGASSFFYLMQVNSSVTFLRNVGDCDLKKAACSAVGDQEREVHFSLSPATIPLMQELTTSVQVRHFSPIQAIQVSVEGINMYMGYQNANLSAVTTEQWQGKFILPICSTETMYWQATVSIYTSDTIFQAKFPFMTTR